MLFAPRKKFGIRLNNDENQQPYQSFYALNAIAADGKIFDFQQLKSKKVLIVNTASDCGFTAQFAELQRLQSAHKDDLQILLFPSNNFKNQEKLNEGEIINFCRTNYKITFPIMAKSNVVQSIDQNAVYKWLTSPELNGWNNHAPDWNFAKYLIDEKGILAKYGGPAVSLKDLVAKNY